MTVPTDKPNEINENTTKDNENESTFVVEPLPFYQQVLRRLSTLPWWSIILGGGIFIILISMYSDENRRDILSWLADDPVVTTDEYFDVTYRVETEALVVAEIMTLSDAQGNRVELPRTRLIAETEGVLECKTFDATTNACLDAPQDLVIYTSFDVLEGAIPDGYVERKALIKGVTPLTGTLSLLLPDGSEDFIFSNELASREISREEGTLDCDRAVAPDCEPLVGTIITYQRPYVRATAQLVRDEVTVRYESDGFEKTLRRDNIKRFRQDVRPCASQQADCELTVTIAEFEERVVGVEIERTEDKVIVRTVAQELETIPKNRILEITMGTVECRRDLDERCQDYSGSIIRAAGETFIGQLTGETETEFKIILPGDNTSTSYLKNTVATQSRQPDGCRYDDTVPCQIEIQLNEAILRGRIEQETSDSIILETVPEKVVSVERHQITSTQRVPATCALNNIRGCNAGIWLTIIVTITAYSLALILGLIFGLMRVSSNPILYHISTFYVELVRGVPLLVILLYFAYVVSPQMRDAPNPIGYVTRPIYDSITQVEIWVLGNESLLGEAVLGLAFGYGAFVAEVFRAGIQSIPKGQMEAARSTGMSYFQAMRHVILPQAFRVVLPPLGNDFIAMLKDSALISVLALPDLLQQGRLFISRTFQPIPTYNAVAVYYIIMTLILSFGVRSLERRTRLPR